MNFQNDKSNEPSQTFERTRTDGELAERIMAGLDRFLSTVFARHPIPLADFLDSSEKYFDDLIIETSENEHLHFIGGKLIFTPEGNSSKAPGQSLFGLGRESGRRASSSCQVQITANLYFQNAQKDWIMKTVQGHTTSTSIKDWDTAPELAELRKGDPIEFPIDSPFDK